MKKLTKIGILLFILSMVIIYISSLNFQNSFTGGSLQALSILAHNTTYISFSLSNVTIVGFVFYTNSTPLNLFLLNQSRFSQLYPLINSSQKLNGSMFAGPGTLLIAYNSVYGIFPYQPNNSTADDTYGYNTSPILPPGNYYAVFQNPAPSSVKAYYSLVIKTQKQISSTILSSAGYGVVGAALFFGGIVIILYSLLSKAKAEEPKIDPAAEEMYSKYITKAKGAKTRKKRKARK